MSMITKKLTEICRPKQWKTISGKDLLPEGYPVLGANGIIGYWSEYNHEFETITIACRGTCGAVRIAGAKSYINGNAMCLDDLSDSVLLEYLYYYLRWYDFSDIITGTSIPQITIEGLRKVMVPIPSISDQQAIINILEKTDAIIQRRVKELDALDDLIKARFVEMFGKPESDEKYPQIAIKDFTDVISGGTPDRKNNEYWENGTIPWVKTTELQNTRINTVEECITEKGLNESSAKVVPEDTVLIAMYGQGKTRGMTAILGIPASTNQACACILPCEEVEPKYLWQYMIMSYDRLRNQAQGGNQPNLNGNMIKNFTVLVPPKELQSQFVQFVEQVDKSKVAVQKALMETKQLFDCMMQQFFGEKTLV